jgi:hypothetical protein
MNVSPGSGSPGDTTKEIAMYKYLKDRKTGAVAFVEEYNYDVVTGKQGAKVVVPAIAPGQDHITFYEDWWPLKEKVTVDSYVNQLKYLAEKLRHVAKVASL